MMMKDLICIYSWGVGAVVWVAWVVCRREEEKRYRDREQEQREEDRQNEDEDEAKEKVE